MIGFFIKQQLEFRKELFKKSFFRGIGLILADVLTTPLQVVEVVVDLQIAGIKTVIHENDLLENWFNVVYKNPSTKILRKIAGPKALLFSLFFRFT